MVRFLRYIGTFTILFSFDDRIDPFSVNQYHKTPKRHPLFYPSDSGIVVKFSEITTLGRRFFVVTSSDTLQQGKTSVGSDSLMSVSKSGGLNSSDRSEANLNKDKKFKNY